MSMTPGQEKMLTELHVAIVGNEEFGHIGLAKRVKLVEEKINSHDPIIKEAMEKKTDLKKLRTTIIAGCITFVLTIAAHVIITLTH